MSTSRTIRGRPIELFPRPLFSVRDAAEYLGVSASTVRRRIAAGALRAHRFGRRWLLWRHDLDGYRAGIASTDGGTPR